MVHSLATASLMAANACALQKGSNRCLEPYNLDRNSVRSCPGVHVAPDGTGLGHVMMGPICQQQHPPTLTVTPGNLETLHTSWRTSPWRSSARRHMFMAQAMNALHAQHMQNSPSTKAQRYCKSVVGTYGATCPIILHVVQEGPAPPCDRHRVISDQLLQCRAKRLSYESSNQQQT